MPEGIVDRLQAIDIEHDQRAAGVIALDVGDRAMEFALEAAPVGNIQQEIGVGRGLEFLDPRLRLGELRLAAGESSPWRRLDARHAAGGSGARFADRPRRGFSPGAPLLRAVLLPSEAVALVFFLHGLPCAGSLKKACRDSPRQDSPFRIPCHALESPGRSYNPAYVSGFPKELTR